MIPALALTIFFQDHQMAFLLHVEDVLMNWWKHPPKNSHEQSADKNSIGINSANIFTSSSLFFLGKWKWNQMSRPIVFFKRSLDTLFSLSLLLLEVWSCCCCVVPISFTHKSAKVHYVAARVGGEAGLMMGDNEALKLLREMPKTKLLPSKSLMQSTTSSIPQNMNTLSYSEYS